MATRRSKRRWRDRGDGGVTALEFVVIGAVVIGLVFSSVQLAAYLYASHAAGIAAEEGAGEARKFDGTAEDGKERARDYADRLAGPDLENLEVSASRTDATATVTVSGDVDLLGLWSLHVEETSSGPVERYVDEAGAVP